MDGRTVQVRVAGGRPVNDRVAPRRPVETRVALGRPVRILHPEGQGYNHFRPPPPPPPPFGYLYLNNDATYSSHVARTTYHGPWDRALKISETLAERCSRGGVGDG